MTEVCPGICLDLAEEAGRKGRDAPEGCMSRAIPERRTGKGESSLSGICAARADESDGNGDDGINAGRETDQETAQVGNEGRQQNGILQVNSQVMDQLIDQ